MTIATATDIDKDFATQCYAQRTHDPEKYAKLAIDSYLHYVNGVHAELSAIAKTDAQKSILQDEIAKYKEGYLKRVNAWLVAVGRTATTLVVGPANFPVQRMEKREKTQERKYEELLQWRKSAHAAIVKKLEGALGRDEATEFKFAELSSRLKESLAELEEIDGRVPKPYERETAVNTIVKPLNKLADGGEIALVERYVAIIREYDATHKKPIHRMKKIWQGIVDRAAAQAKADEELANKPDETIVAKPGLTVTLCWTDNRVRLAFADKPAEEMIRRLRKEAFKWSPTNSAWQRQLTTAGIQAAKRVAECVPTLVEQ